MESVLEEFKTIVAKTKSEYKAMTKEEKKNFRAKRHSTNAYVDEVTKDWRIQKEKIIQDSLAELGSLMFEQWNTKTPPTNIFQMEHVS